MAPHICLHEVGAPFEARPISGSKAKQELRKPEYLAINPEGKVPTLVIDGRPLTEVAAILFYLARRFPDAALLPQGDIEAEARVISWMSFIASSIHATMSRELGVEPNRTVWTIANNRLGKREWAVGRYSIADIHLFRLYWRFRNASALAPTEFPNLEAHHDRMMVRPAVRRTIEIEAKIGYELQGYRRPPVGT
jgi:glutathione S-transferase